MGLRELKETAHQQFVRGKFAQCAQTYQQILRLAPRDPNLRVRHAEACRRAGDRMQAIASYRAAAELLLELGCETRARGALKAALELDPRDPMLQVDIARLEPQILAQDDLSFGFTGFHEPDELPLLPPLETPVRAPRLPRPVLARPVTEGRRALPPIHRALPQVPSVPVHEPPVLLPAPMPRPAARGAQPSAPQPVAALPAQRPGTVSRQPPVLQPVATPTPPPRPAAAGYQPPVIQPVAMPAPSPRTATANSPPPGLQPAATPTPPPRSATARFLAPASPPETAAPPQAHAECGSLTPTLEAAAPRASAPAHGKAVLPPSPPEEAILEVHCEALAVAEHAPLGLEAERAPRHRVEVRRLAPNAIAFRCSPDDSWALIRSREPLEMHLVADLAKLPPEARPSTLEGAAEPSPGSAVH